MVTIKYSSILLVLPVFFTFIKPGLTIDCYQCNSTLDHNCQEKFDHNQEKNPIRPSYCTVWGAKYCIKVTGLWGGIVGTHRFCSSRNLGNQCQDLSYPDHDRIYRACMYTCSADNCNSAINLQSSARTVITTILFSAFVGVLKYFF